MWLPSHAGKESNRKMLRCTRGVSDLSQSPFTSRHESRIGRDKATF